MAINRIWHSGGELGTVLEADVAYGSSMQTGDQVTGAYYLYSRANSNGVAYFVKYIPETRQIRYGLFLNPAAIGTVSPITVIRIVGADFTTLVELRYVFTGGTFQLIVDGVLRDTIVGGYAPLNYQHIGMDMKIDPVSGWVNVYINGLLKLSYSGDTGDVDIVEMYFGKVAAPSTCEFHMDDVYLDDTTGEGAPALPPLLRFYYVSPNGAGNYTQWTPSAGSNYQCVDEIPPDDADYVETNVVDEFDSYAMATITLEAAQTLYAVIPTVYARRYDLTEQLALGTRYSATDLVGSDQLLVTAEKFYFERQTTKPGGGAWDQSALDGFEFLMKSRGSY